MVTVSLFASLSVFSVLIAAPRGGEGSFVYVARDQIITIKLIFGLYNIIVIKKDTFSETNLIKVPLTDTLPKLITPLLYIPNFVDPITGSKKPINIHLLFFFTKHLQQNIFWPTFMKKCDFIGLIF